MILQDQSGQSEAGTSKSTDAAEAESRILTELDSKWSCVGDVDGLQKDIQTIGKLVDEARKKDMSVEVGIS